MKINYRETVLLLTRARLHTSMHKGVRIQSTYNSLAPTHIASLDIHVPECDAPSCVVTLSTTVTMVKCPFL